MSVRAFGGEMSSLLVMSALGYGALKIGTSLNPMLGVANTVSQYTIGKGMDCITGELYTLNYSVFFPRLVSQWLLNAALMSYASIALNMPITFSAALILPFQIVLISLGVLCVAIPVILGVGACAFAVLRNQGIITDAHILAWKARLQGNQPDPVQGNQPDLDGELAAKMQAFIDN